MAKVEVAGFLWPSLSSYRVTAATYYWSKSHRANHNLREMSCTSQMEEWQRICGRLQSATYIFPQSGRFR